MGHVFLGVLIPSLTLSGLYLVYYLVRGIMDSRGRSVPDIKVPEGGTLGLFFFAAQNLVLPVGLISMVLGSIIWGLATPSQSGALGAAGGLALMVIKRKFTLPNLHGVIKKTALMTSMVFFIVMAANVFSYPFRFFGGDNLIADFLWGLGLNDWGVLLAVLGIIFVLGFFIDWIEITVITLPIFLPVLEKLDMTAHLLHPELTKLWIGVLIALVLQTSFMTPPFGFALFFVKGASPPSVKLSDVYRGAVPLVGIQLATLFLLMAFPLLATWLPNLVFD
ncbi:MAG: TRAP transporter large permease subunit [bacterium]